MPKFEKPVNPYLKSELETIKQLPKEARRSRIQEFKEKVVEQKLGIAKMQEKFTEIIHRESAMPIKDMKIILEAALDQYAKEYDLDDYQKTVSREVVGRFLENNKSIRRVNEAFPGDDQKLFQALFGFKPNGEIRIRTTPVMIYVQCFNPYDYAYLRTQQHIQHEDLSKEEQEIAAMSYGAAGIRSKLKSVDKLIALENSSMAGVKEGGEPKKDIFDHEEQHITKKLFDEESLHALAKFGPNMSPEEFQGVFEKNLRYRREDEGADRRAKDEILAYFKGGTRKEKIYEELTEKSGYDYLKSLKGEYANPSQKVYKKYTPIVEKSVQKILVEEYHEIIKNGIEAVMILERMQYSKDQIVGLLVNEPLARWPKLVKRIKDVGK